MFFWKTSFQLLIFLVIDTFYNQGDNDLAMNLY